MFYCSPCTPQGAFMCTSGTYSATPLSFVLLVLTAVCWRRRCCCSSANTSLFLVNLQAEKLTLASQVCRLDVLLPFMYLYYAEESLRVEDRRPSQSIPPAKTWYTKHQRKISLHVANIVEQQQAVRDIRKPKTDQDHTHQKLHQLISRPGVGASGYLW